MKSNGSSDVRICWRKQGNFVCDQQVLQPELLRAIAAWKKYYSIFLLAEENSIWFLTE
jgi:hypothetical protein